MHIGRVTMLAQGQDTGVFRTVRALEWDISEMLDRNHVAKSFDIKMKGHLFVPGTRRGHWLPVLREIEHGLEMWCYSCLKMDDDDDDIRTAKRLGAKKHWVKSGWNDKGDGEAVKLLDEFTCDTGHLIRKVHSRFSTQLCECLNSMKAKLASKGISWKNSWDARVCVAILNFNWGTTGSSTGTIRLLWSGDGSRFPRAATSVSRPTSRSQLLVWVMRGSRTLGWSRRSDESLARLARS
jgi:hypothetical protein